MEYGDFIAHSLAKTVPVWKVQGRDSVYKAWQTIDTVRNSNPLEGESQARVLKQEATQRFQWTRVTEAREPSPYYGRFFVGQHVKVHPSTTRFMQGFQYGKVTRVGRQYVTVEWTGSSEVVSKFIPEFLAPEVWTYDLT